MNSCLLRYRLSLGFFILGLILSGLTAFPLLAELRLLGRMLGIVNPADYQNLTGLHHWIASVWFGLEQTYAQFSFIGYGTDWLAFGHLCLAVFFIRPFWRPLESDWVLKCGLICCIGVIPLALIAGAVRGIPFYWQLIDCSFGVLGAVPLLYCLRLTQRMRHA
ncbi:MAG: hypothetical protein KA257_03170 [Opitutaceae bacterium]|nr:hypothetical protein [Opitutaceae bacterium]MBP9912227.1 hypothetical protein [Opitutaceae bacterium]